MHSLDVRYRAVVHYTHFCKSLRKVAKTYGVSKSSLSRWVSQRDPLLAQKSKKKKTLLSDVKETIRSALHDKPFTTAKQMSHILKTSCGLTPSRSTVSRWIKLAGYTWKKAFKHVAIHHDSDRIMTFCNQYMSCAPNDIVCIDEMAFYVGERPSRGYALRGKRLNVSSERSLRPNVE
jgi:transposase